MARRTIQSRLWIVFCLLSAMVWVFTLSGCRPTTTIEEEVTPTPYPTPVIPTKPIYTVQAGEVVKSMEFSGRVSPVLQEDLYFRTSGRVINVLVKKGEKITSGQLLAEVESGASEIDVRRAEIYLEMAKLNFQRTQLNTPSYARDHEIILAMGQYEVELAQLSLDDLNSRISNAQIIAPFDATVMSLSFTKDTQVEAYKPVITVADLTQLEVTAELLSQELQSIEEGLTGLIWPVNSPDKILEANIARLPYPYGRANPDKPVNKDDKSTHIEISGTPESIGLELGSLVRVKVILESRPNVLWLPPQAIRTFEGRKFVVIKDDTGQKRADIKVGISSEDRVEILEGLSEGQVVVAP